MKFSDIKNTDNTYGYFRVATVAPRVKVGDVAFNLDEITETAREVIGNGALLAVYPELSLTGYTCADLFANELLLKQSEAALCCLCENKDFVNTVLVVGAPLRHDGHLFNCAVVIAGGRIVAAIPKSYIPNYKEFYEKRWMTSALAAGDVLDTVKIGGKDVPFGTDIMVTAGKAVIGFDVCEDLWAPIPPSSLAAVNGANIIVNISASNEVVGKHDFLDNLIKHQSGQTLSAYVYSSAGYGESTTDLVYAGKGIIAENGCMIAETERFTRERKVAYADLDLDLIDHERRVNTSFGDSMLCHGMLYRRFDCGLEDGSFSYNEREILHPVDPMPFVPCDDQEKSRRCREVLDIQTYGLIRRLEHTGIKSIVLGVSGGLDSTLALMVAVRAFDELGLDRKGIHGITMPGFGTSGRTHTNALQLMEALGVTTQEIPIAAAVKQHFLDIGHDGVTHDVTYENSQARERTQILMDLSNRINGLVLGTGDLSELALGWATYNGDHMSMYNVNGSIPKTLARYLVGWLAEEYGLDTVVGSTLSDVVATPISPELTPTDEKGEIAQKTEDLIGPYDLNDFYLFNMLRYGYEPRKIFRLACQAFDGRYDKATIKRWLTTFTRRFFNQQFKRSCLPDGPKVGTVSLSPRGDWRMPSDAVSRLWLEQCDALEA